MYLSELRIENFRRFGEGDAALTIRLQPGLNVLVGENDAGKSAVIDAIRFALGTTSQDRTWIEDADFHYTKASAPQFSIRCNFDGLKTDEQAAFAEHLTFENKGVVLYVNYTASRTESPNGRSWHNVDVRSGRHADGPPMEYAARRFLQTTYLKPLRDADHELSSGRNSRLAQILQYVKEVAGMAGEEFDPGLFVEAVERQQKPHMPGSVVNIAKLADHLIERNKGVGDAKKRLDETYLSKLQLKTDGLSSRIGVAEARDEAQRLRRTLEKLDLRLATAADSYADLPHGLGYSNLLFMACELLLLGQEDDKLPLLLIEEPEAHLHPQLQLRLMEFLNGQTRNKEGRSIQVILTTHSPNLASKANLESIVMISGGCACPMGAEHTKLSEADYRFLQRFLDVTKANLFFARGVLIVEGDAEALLLPTIARLIGYDLTEHGVSIVNVGGRGLRRYARIFQRKTLVGGASEPPLATRIACLADRDVKPDCAREILKIDTGTHEAHLPNAEARNEWVKKLQAYDDQATKTFVSDHWTLEYDLAYAGLGLEVFQAISLAKEETRSDPISAADPAERKALLEKAAAEYANTQAECKTQSDARERTATHIYKPLLGNVSKAITAHYLSELLAERYEGRPEDLKTWLPNYLCMAIEYVCGTGTETPGAARLVAVDPPNASGSQPEGQP